MSTHAPEPQPTPEPTPDSAPTPDPTPPADEFQPITSQEDFDRAIQARLRREREKFSDYDELKSAKTKLDEIEAANATELEKAQKRAEDAEKKAADTEAKARATAQRSAILAEAAKPDRKMVDPSAALAFLLGEDADLIETDDAGEITNLPKALDALLERRSYLVDSNGGGRRDAADQGARGGEAGVQQVTREELQRMSPEEQTQALKDGRLEKLKTGG